MEEEKKINFTESVYFPIILLVGAIAVLFISTIAYEEFYSLKNKTGVNNMEQWTKIEDKIFRFENAGDNIEGKYLSSEDSKLYDNQVYKIENSEGIWTVFGTTVLDSKMKKVDVGSEVRIIFTGEQANKNKNQSPIKLFDVFTK